MDRVRRVENQIEMERSIDEFITRGYTLQSKGVESATLRETDWGDAEVHLLIAGISFWWTFGLANALYAIYSRMNAEEVVIRLENGYRADIAEVGVTKEEKSDEEQNSHRYSVQDEIGGEKRTLQTFNKPLVTILSHIGLQIFSLFVASFLIFIILAAYTVGVEVEVIGLTIATLTASLVFRYTAVYHHFSKLFYKIFFLILTSLILIVTGGFTIMAFLGSVDASQILRTFQNTTFQLQLDMLLPEWWVAIILSVGGILLFIGAAVTRDFTPYPKPTSMREISTSPAYFGVVSSIFGIWAVLFVGFNVQRIIIAPIFEEILKFGVALLVSSVLFGRSTLSRIGTAIVVGSLFGFIEHATSYPSEPEAVFLFRTLFHMMTTVLSISIYSAFEAHSEKVLQTIAPLYSIIIHFFYNTFLVISSIIIAMWFGMSAVIPSLIYGSLAILLTTVIFFISVTRYHTIRTLHLPLKKVLSHLV